MILGSWNLSKLALARSSDKTVIYIIDQLFPLSRSCKGTIQGQAKLLYQKHLIVLVIFKYCYGAYWIHFQTYFKDVLYWLMRELMVSVYLCIHIHVHPAVQS